MLQVTYSPDELSTYLDTVEFPTLTIEAAQRLDGPITLKEVQVAMKSLQVGKTPGPDGLPTEFYKTNLEVIAPYYFETLTKALVALPPVFYVRGRGCCHT